MNALVKQLLLWLMIAALPVQGMAAVMKASCGPAHHQSQVAASELHGVHHHADKSAQHALPSLQTEHEHIQNHAHDLRSGAHLNDHVAAAVDPAHFDDNAGASVVPVNDSCSACATCCVGAAAPPSSAISAASLAVPEVASLLPALPLAGFIPAGLERPPKQFSA